MNFTMELDCVKCGNCVELMQNLPSECIDLVVTSPPYDNLRDYKGYSFDFENVAKQLYRVMKKGGVVVWVVNDATINGSETGTSFRQALYFKDIGFNLHDTMIYKKTNPTPQKSNRYQPCFEYMFVFSKGKPKTFNPIMTEKKYLENRKEKQYNKSASGEQIKHEYKYSSNMKVISNIWEYSVGLYNSTSDKEAFGHPAVFPEKLAEDHIITWTKEGDVVLDPFCGSGTTVKMAKINHRHYIGFDISQEYCDIANLRLSKV